MNEDEDVQVNVIVENNKFVLNHFYIIQDKIESGETPNISPFYKNSTNVDVQALVHLLERCWSLHPDDRPTMKQIVAYLQNAIGNSKETFDGKIDWKSIAGIDDDDDDREI